MIKAPDAYRSIGEVAQLVGVAPHVLRYWEAQFPQLSPVKRADGRRYYRLEDVQLAAGLCEVLREEGLTIRGARRLISLDRGADLRARGERRLQSLIGSGLKDAAPGAGAKTRPRKASATVKPRRAKGPADAPAPARTTKAAPVLPAVPAPDLPPSTATGTAPSDKPAQSWLARLTATASHLRTRTQALPPEARALVARLHDARSVSAIHRS